MHELSLCQALLDQVRATARAHQASGVGRITLRLGPLAGVEADLLARAFSVARNGELTAEASLHIEPQPIRIRCRDCGHDNEAAANRLLCAACGSFRIELLSGDEMLLAQVELHGVERPSTN